MIYIFCCNTLFKKNISSIQTPDMFHVLQFGNCSQSCLIYSMLSFFLRYSRLISPVSSFVSVERKRLLLKSSSNKFNSEPECWTQKRCSSQRSIGAIVCSFFSIMFIYVVLFFHSIFFLLHNTFMVFSITVWTMLLFCVHTLMYIVNMCLNMRFLTVQIIYLSSMIWKAISIQILIYQK